MYELAELVLLIICLLILLCPQAPDAPGSAQATEVIEPLVPAKDSGPTLLDKEPAPDTSAAVILDDFDLPLKKKKRRPVSV